MSAVRARGLHRRFGAVAALDGLDLDVPAGRVFGLLGPNGAGKTTTIHLLLGILPPDAGTIHVFGTDVARRPTEVRAACGVLLEHDGLYERLTAAENLLFYGRAHGLARADVEERMEPLLREARLWERRDDRVQAFSRGMKRRLGIVRAFLHGPRLAILDEPTSGLDARAAKEVQDLLRLRSREHGTTVLITTHDLREAEALCDEVAVLDAGRRVGQGVPHRLGGGADRLELHGTYPASFVAALRRRRGIAEVAAVDGVVVLTLRDGTRAAPIVAAAVRAGAKVEEVRRVRPNLEEGFLKVLEDA